MDVTSLKYILPFVSLIAGEFIFEYAGSYSSNVLYAKVASRVQG